MSTLIIGASGQIGRIITARLRAKNAPVRAMVRTQSPGLAELGAELYIGDLEEDFSAAFNGCEQVIFTAGSGAQTGADKTILVDMWGAIKAIDYAKAAGVNHFIMVSSRGAEDPDNGPAAIKHYSVCKKMADDHLQRSQLDYTILRPGRLLNDPPLGSFNCAMPSQPERQIITRADVADACVYCLSNPQTLNKIYPLVNGDDSLADAMLKSEG